MPLSNYWEKSPMQKADNARIEQFGEEQIKKSG